MKRYVFAAAGSVLLSAIAAPAFAGTDFTKALTEGKVSADIRARHEYVDADGKQDGAADTVRTRLGYTTGDFYNVSAMFEVENVAAIGSEDYNDGANGKTAFVGISDPETTEINQAYLQYDMYDTTLRGGRQVIAYNDKWFIGDASKGRQNQTSFDAVSLNSKFVPHLTADYAYVWAIHNSLGNEAASGARDSDSHLFNLTTDIIPYVSLTGFAYLIDLKSESPTLSSDTYGLQANGKYKIDDNWKLMGTLVYANQTDAGSNPTDYEANNYRAVAGAGYKSFTAKLGYEELEGDGARSFTTPFASGFTPNGLADVINRKSTITNGLEDTWIEASLELAGVYEYIDGLTIGAQYHDFNAEQISSHYGSEYDLSLGKKFGKHYYADIVYGNYDADNFSVDTQRLFFQVGAKF